MEKYGNNRGELNNISSSHPFIEVLDKDITASFCEGQVSLRDNHKPIIKWSQNSRGKIVIVENAVVTTPAIDQLCASFTEFCESKKEIKIYTAKNLYECLPDYIDFVNAGGKNADILINTLSHKDNATG